MSKGIYSEIYLGLRTSQTEMCEQWRSKAKCRPGPTKKVPPFPPLKFAYKSFKWKLMFRANFKI